MNIFTKHRSHLDDRPWWLEVFIWEHIANELLYLGCKSIIQNLQIKNTVTILKIYMDVALEKTYWPLNNF